MLSPAPRARRAASGTLGSSSPIMAQCLERKRNIGQWIRRSVRRSRAVRGRSFPGGRGLPFPARGIAWRCAGPCGARQMADEDDEIILSELPDDELVLADARRPLRRPQGRGGRGGEHPARPRLDALRRPDQGAGRGDAHRRHRLPRRHPVRARGAAGGQLDEGRDGDPEAAPRSRPARRASARW